MQWRLELFGGPRLLSPDGEIVDRFATQKTAGLLSYLALTLPRSHPREILAELFWPDRDPVLARNSLSVALSSLRPVLGKALVSGRLRVGLDPARIVTDLAEFEAAMADGDAVRARQLSVLEFLPGFYDDWATLERERLAARLESAPKGRSEALRTPARHNLPEPLVSFIGRDRERRELADLLETARLVTLTGSGGSGKTRLSHYVARDVMERFEHGVWLVPLASFSDPALVVRSVAATLEVEEAPGKPLLATLILALKGKEILLLLDNCEHLLETSARLVDTLLQSCPSLRVLATSREALGVAGEFPYRIPSLTLGDAIGLFVERAAAHCREFVQTERNTPLLMAICVRLDGIPLAIELAAARLRTLSLEELSARLYQSLTLLTGGPRTVPPRHQTLRGLIDWSYNLLVEEEKTLLCRLSIFAGGWTLDAAEKVCSGRDIEEGAVLDLLTSLVDKSLVVVDSGPLESTRYHLLETVRQYAQERFKERGAESAQIRHLEYFRVFCQLSFPRQYQADAVTEFDQIEREHDNIRIALQFGTSSSDEILQRKALEITGMLRRFWYMRSYLEEATQWYGIVLSLPVVRKPSEAQGRCLLGMAGLAKVRGDYAEARALLEKCIVDQQAIRHDVNVAIAYTGLGMLSAEDSEEALASYRKGLHFAKKGDNLNAIAHATINIGIILKSRDLLEKGIALARLQGNKDLIAAALGALGELVSSRGGFSEAIELGKENLKLCREIGANHSLVIALNCMGKLMQGAGDLTSSRMYRNECLNLALKFKIDEIFYSVIEDIAVMDNVEGRYERAAKLWGAASFLKMNCNVVAFNRDTEINRLRETLGISAFDGAFEEGARLSVRQVIALATSLPPD